jgi:hypothetical protein
VAVEFTSIDSILSFYDKNENSNYTIFRGTKCQHVADLYKAGNKEQGYDQLNEFLKGINNANEYVLQINSSKASKDLLPSCIFKLEKKEDRQQLGNYYNGNSEVLNRLASIESRLQDGNTDEEDYIEEQPKDFIGQILQQDGVKEMLISSIGALITNFIQPKLAGNTVLAGINESEETAQTIEESLQILFNKGLTANDLYLLSKKTQTELNYLLKLLRS